MNPDFKEQLFNFNPPNDKIINQYLYEVEPVPHFDEQYQNKLMQNQQFKNIKAKEETVKKILNKVPLDEPHNPSSEICQICFEEVGRRKKWCRVCGKTTCRTCLTRKRVMINEQIVDYCEECDKAFLQAMEIKQFLDSYNKFHQAFLKLAQEQEMTEKLLAIEKNKTKENQEQVSQNQLLKLSKIIVEKRIQNKGLKVQLTEINRKIQWGTEVNGHLKNKERRMRKVHQNSFSSSVNDQTDSIEPPKVDSQAISVQNLNESLIQSLLETENQESHTTIQPRKCSLDNCSLF